MKGLALEIVWGIIIAIASVLVFLSLITGTFQSAANWFYCNVYLKILSFFNREMASIPENCKPIARKWEVKIEKIRESDNKIFSRILLAYIIACWKEAEIKGLYKTHPCYELHLLNEVEDVTEYNVSQILIREDHCTSIENSDYGCGEKDQIVWNVEGGIIRNQKIILIEYNHEKDAVEVIG
ncbi:MAG: hypothetical protein QXI09_03200 [Candidatus Aenigmatarchaeota archaeon]